MNNSTNSNSDQLSNQDNELKLSTDVKQSNDGNPVEETKELKLSTDVKQSNDGDPIEETKELIDAVGSLTRDAYVETVKNTKSFIKFLNKKIKPNKGEDINK